MPLLALSCLGLCAKSDTINSTISAPYQLHLTASYRYVISVIRSSIGPASVNPLMPLHFRLVMLVEYSHLFHLEVLEAWRGILVVCQMVVCWISLVFNALLFYTLKIYFFYSIKKYMFALTLMKNRVNSVNHHKLTPLLTHLYHKTTLSRLHQ